MDRDLAYIIDRCLKVDPEKRFRSAGSLLAALDWRRRLAQRPVFLIGLVGTFLVLMLLAGLGLWGGYHALSLAQDALIKQLGNSNKASAEPVALKIKEELGQRIKCSRKTPTTRISDWP